ANGAFNPALPGAPMNQPQDPAGWAFKNNQAKLGDGAAFDFYHVAPNGNVANEADKTRYAQGLNRAKDAEGKDRKGDAGGKPIMEKERFGGLEPSGPMAKRRDAEQRAKEKKELQLREAKPEAPRQEAALGADRPAQPPMGAGGMMPRGGAGPAGRPM